MKRFISLLLIIVTIIYVFPVLTSAALPFSDTVKGSWYEESLRYCYEHGYMKGTAKNKFSPAGKLTRAMAVQIFYSINEVDIPETTDSFNDVKQSYWFYNAVEWAYSAGIVSGTGEGRFSPNLDVTRQDFYVILYNYSSLYSHYDNVIIDDNYLYFDDNASIADYALSAMNWAARHGFLSGYPDNTVRPYSTMTRAEITSVIKRFDDTLGHRWTAREQKPATCIEGGYIKYICEGCPASKQVSFDMLDHSWEVLEGKNATCLEDGYYKYICRGCNAQKEETLPAKGHSWYIYTAGEGTCISKGSYEYRCTGCATIRSEEGGYGAHSFILTSTVKPTRTKQGYSIYTCEYCGGTNHNNYTPALGRTEGWDSNYDGKLTIDEYFGAYGIVDFLASHQSDYVGTPYKHLADYLSRPWMLTHDRGQYPYSPGMNCTGFIASVINRSGGNLGRVSNVSGGSYANAYNWYLTLNRNGVQHYTFYSAKAALNSGKLKKGDIFLFLPEYKDSDPNDGLDPDFHFGIFWGDYPTHDRFWHSTGATKYNWNAGVRGMKNQITRIGSGTPYSCIYVYPLSEEN